MDCFVACAPRNDGHDFRSPGPQPYGFTFQTARRTNTASRSRRGFSREFYLNVLSSCYRGRRECRALNAPAASCVKKQTHERSHHGHTGTTRHSPRNGFTAYFALSPVTRLV